MSAATTFDPKAHLEARNAAEEARKHPEQVKVEATPPPVPEQPKVAEPDDKGGHLPRSARRELNRLREELGELRGQLKAYKEIAPQRTAEPETRDEKPKRENFSTDAEYAGEVGAWAARQGLDKAEKDRAVTAQIQAKLDAAAAAKPAQIEALGDDWDKYQEEGEELKIDSDEERMLFATSRYAVFVGAYFVDHPKAWEEFKELADDPLEQRDYFKHIEGEAKIEYSKAKAAQAKEKPPKDRTHPAEAQAGRNLPRPSSEAAARGGTAVPNEPPVGSAAWIRARNAAKAPTRF